jgi:hypothetical protein
VLSYRFILTSGLLEEEDDETTSQTGDWCNPLYKW